MAKRRLKTAEIEPSSPPAKRTRSRAILAETQPEVAADQPPVRVHAKPKPSKSNQVVESEKTNELLPEAEAVAKLPRGRAPRAPASRKRAVRSSAKVAENEALARESSLHVTRPKGKRGRPKKSPPGIPANAPDVALPRSPSFESIATSSRVMLEQSAIEDVSSSELRQSPLAEVTPATPRPATPTRSGPVRGLGTPKYILEVVVNTPPPRLRNPVTRSVPPVQPRISTPILTTPKGNKRSLSPVKSPQPVATTISKGPNDSEVIPESEYEDAEDEEPLTESLSIVDPVIPTISQASETMDALPERVSMNLPTEVQDNLDAQKHAVLKALRKFINDITTSEEHPDTNGLAFEQLSALFRGTVERGEGNSCFLTGPRGSGKTELVQKAIDALPNQPIVLRLSGHVQTNDRLAMREIAWQLAEQTGKTLLPSNTDVTPEGDENPFLDHNVDETAITLPPPAHLLALISVIPTLPRPTVIIIDAIDLFALHARQALLYCLLDTTQSCRAGKGNRGIAVVGVTSRVDTINMLEKRVKSRFSGRMLRTACPRTLDHWTRATRAALATPVLEVDSMWSEAWKTSVNTFMDDRYVTQVFKETFALTRDMRMLTRLLIPPVLSLSPYSPFLTASALQVSAAGQRSPERFAFLSTLAYPAVCLLIAATHARTSGHDTFTFEMLHETFRDQVRASQSAPVQIEGGGIGMVNCDREVLMGAYEQLISLRVFVHAVPVTAGTTFGFMRHRCTVDRAEVKKVVEQIGQLNLKKWFSKS